MREVIDSLKQKLYGNNKSEALERAQIMLELEGLEEVLIEKEKEAQAQKESKRKDSKPQKRFVFPENAEEREERILPAEVEANPEDYEEIGKPEVTRILDIEPMKFIVRKIVRPRFRKKSNADQAPLVAPTPERVLKSGMPGVRLLVHIILAKYLEHMPLYRMEQTFKRRYEVDVNRKTMCSWIEHVAHQWLALIYHSIKSDLLSGSYLHIDETPIRYIDRDFKGRSRNGYLWAYVNITGDLCFDWQTGRSTQCLESFLGEYNGLIQCDGYSAYRSYRRVHGNLLVGCMAHARRYFKEAWDLGYKKQTAWYLLQFKELFDVETTLRNELEDNPCLDITKYRSIHARPLFDALVSRIKKERAGMDNGNALSKAADYFLNNLNELSRYLYYADSAIDNNAAERIIRPTKVGVKNWLFIGHPEAGQRSAIIYTIIGNCINQGINPEEYLADILNRLPHCSSSVEVIQKLTPKAWKEERCSK